MYTGSRKFCFLGCWWTCLTVAIGRLPHDTPSYLYQLAIYWRCHPFFRDTGPDSFHLQCCIWPHRVSVPYVSLDDIVLTLHSGLFIYTALNSLIWLVMFLSRGRILPAEHDLKEYWTCTPAGEKPWFIRTFTKGRFWTDDRRRSKDEMELNEISGSAHNSHVGSATSNEEKGLELVATPRRSVLSRD